MPKSSVVPRAVAALLLVVVVLGRSGAGAAPSHTGPPLGATGSLTWVEQLPLELLADLAGTGRAVVVASAAGHPVTTTKVTLGQPADIDVTEDGKPDLRATVSVARPGRGRLALPAMTLDVVRLGRGLGPADVEVLAATPVFDVGGLPVELPSLVMGFRTAKADGVPGGHLPARETMSMSLDADAVADVRQTLKTATTKPPSPLRFLLGFTDAPKARPDHAAMAAVFVDPVPSSFTLGVDRTGSPVGAKPELSVGVDWSAPPKETRPDVEVELLLDEGRPKSEAGHGTALVFERMPSRERVTLDVSPDGDGVALTHQGAGLRRLGVDHRRADGLEVTASLTDVPSTVAVSLSDTLRVDAPGNRFDVELTVASPTPLVSTPALSRGLSHLHVRLVDTPSLEASVGDKGEIEFAPQTPGQLIGGADVVLADRADPTIPAAGWPDGTPGSWPAPDRHAAALVDGDRGTTLAVRFHRLTKLRVEPFAPSLAEIIGIDTAEGGEMRIDVALDPGTPLTGPVGTTVGCRAEIPAGRVDLDLDLPDRFGWTLEGGIGSLECRARRGQVQVDLAATDIPAGVQFGAAPDGIEVTVTDENGTPAAVGSIDLVASGTTPSGSLGQPGFAGRPIAHIGVHLTDVPSMTASWTSGAESTDLGVATVHPGSSIRRLEVVTSTEADPPELDTGTDHHVGLTDTDAHSTLHVRLHDVRGLAGKVGTDEARYGVELVTNAARRLTVAVLADAGAALSQKHDVDGRCDVDAVPREGFRIDVVGTTEVSWATTDRIARIDCSARVRTPGSPGEPGSDVTAVLAVRDLPAEGGVVIDPERSFVLTTGPDPKEAVETVHLAVFDPNALVPGTDLLGLPLRGVAVRLDDSPGVRGTWERVGDAHGIEFAVTDGFVAGAARLHLTSDAALVALDRDDRKEHGGEVTVTAERAVVDLRFADVRLGRIDTDHAAGTVQATLATDGAHPVDLTFAEDHGVGLLPDHAVAARLQLADLPDQAVAATDLRSRFAWTGSAPIGGLRVDATVDDDPDADGRTAVAAEILGLPQSLVVDATDLTVEASGQTQSIDVWVTDDSTGGIVGTGLDEVRLVVADLPGDLAVDPGTLTGSIDVPDPDDPLTVVAGLAGTASVSGGSDGPIGRLAVEVVDADDGGVGGTGYGFVSVDLHDVPTSWSVDLTHDGTTGDSAVQIDPEGALGSVEVAVARGGRADVDDLVRRLTAGSAQIPRTATTVMVDDGYWPASVADRIDQVSTDAVTLDVVEVPVTPPPGTDADGATRPVPTVDHLLFLGDALGPDVLRARISGLATLDLQVEAATDIGLQLERSIDDDQPLFVGLLEHVRADYPGRPDFPDVDADDGAPPTSNDTVNVDPDLDGAGTSVSVAVLRNDVERADGDDRPADDLVAEQIDVTTLEVVGGPSSGTATVDGARIVYAPDENFAGWDLLTYRVCGPDGACATAGLRVGVRERYDSVQLVRIGDQPQEIDLAVDGTIVVTPDDPATERDESSEVWELRGVTYDADDGLGRVDVFTGWLEPLVTAVPGRTRIIVEDAPADLFTAFTSTDPDGLSDGFVTVIASAETDLVLATENAVERQVVGARGAEFRYLGRVDDLFVPGTDAAGNPITVVDPAQLGACPAPVPGTVCHRLMRRLVSFDMESDDGVTGSGFYGRYRRSTTFGGAVEFTPELTVMADDMVEVTGGFDLQMHTTPCGLPVCPAVIIPLVDLVFDGTVSVDWWDEGWSFTIPAAALFGFDITLSDEPDWRDPAGPWKILGDSASIDPFPDEE